MATFKEWLATFPEWNEPRKFSNFEAALFVKMMHQENDTFTIGQLADKWQWSKSRVHKFLNLRIVSENGQKNEERTAEGTRNQAAQANRQASENGEKNEERTAKRTESTKRFVKPSVKDVDDYCKSRKNSVNAQDFIDYYDSCGWVIGASRKPMKDWKAAVRNTWEKKRGFSHTDPSTENIHLDNNKEKYKNLTWDI